jgi:hypothetical protein
MEWKNRKNFYRLPFAPFPSSFGFSFSFEMKISECLVHALRLMAVDGMFPAPSLFGLDKRRHMKIFLLDVCRGLNLFYLFIDLFILAAFIYFPTFPTEQERKVGTSRVRYFELYHIVAELLGSSYSYQPAFFAFCTS